MQSHTNNLFSNLPLEVLSSILIKNKDVTDSCLSFKQTSKSNALMLTAALKNPAWLFDILTHLPNEEINRFLSTFFSPTSVNYAAIKKAYLKKNHFALICFALMTEEVSKLTWVEINEALTSLHKQKLLTGINLKDNALTISKIGFGLMVTQCFCDHSGGYEGLDKRLATIEKLLKQMPRSQQIYVNLSGLNLSYNGYAELYYTSHNLFPTRNSNLFEKIIMKYGDVFSGLNLRGAVLNRVPLKETNLKDACLIDADLRGTNLSRTTIKGADFRRATIKDLLRDLESEKKELEQKLIAYRFGHVPLGELMAEQGQRGITWRSVVNPLAPRMIKQLIEMWKDIVDLEKLCQSPDSLTERLHYLSQIELDDDVRLLLREKIIAFLLALENTPHNLSLLEAARHYYFPAKEIKHNKLQKILRSVDKMLLFGGAEKPKKLLDDRIKEFKK